MTDKTKQACEILRIILDKALEEQSKAIAGDQWLAYNSGIIYASQIAITAIKDIMEAR